MAEETSRVSKNEERYGARVALAAFDSMKKAKERENEVSIDAKAFIEECEKEGANPIDVVKFVAGQHGIELSGKRPEENGFLYDLLREVVDIVVEGFFEDEEDGGEDEDDESDPTVLVARNKPVRRCRAFWYTFTL